MGIRRSGAPAGAFFTPAVSATLQGGDAPVCELVLSATVTEGPSAGQSWTGTLSLPIATDGDIANGELALDEGDTLPVVGTTAGRALALRVSLDAETALTLFGTAELDVALCRSNLFGPLGGPQQGDLGTWTAVRSR